METVLPPLPGSKASASELVKVQQSKRQRKELERVEEARFF